MRKKFKTPEELLYKWQEYKDYCNNQKVLVHDFSSKNSEFVSAKLKKSVTYTIEGFCVFAGISRQAFYKDYADNRRYVDIVTRMREECEIDVIPTQLAGLWMSKYGYTTKQEVTDDTAKAAAIKNIENLVKQMHEVDDDDVAD